MCLADILDESLLPSGSLLGDGLHPKPAQRLTEVAQRHDIIGALEIEVDHIPVRKEERRPDPDLPFAFRAGEEFSHLTTDLFTDGRHQKSIPWIGGGASILPQCTIRASPQNCCHTASGSSTLAVMSCGS
ncbi:MAG: hypothetical protein M5U32_19180 [Myxococcota bacterium]|nr:hypothetical protein [Myxococcota bacterium]